MFDDDQKIIYTENNIVRYIGKLNMDMKYHDHCGCLYVGNNNYTGKFEDGKFISGILNLPNGKFKGEFNNLSLEGNGVIEFNQNNSKFTGEFSQNKCELGVLSFEHETQEIKVKCKAIFDKNNFVINSLLSENNELSINKDEKYIGNIKLIHKSDNIFKLESISLGKCKHYVNNILKYNGHFRGFKYHSKGIKYHINGNIEMNGTFDEGEPIHCDYFDEHGNLIYSDINNYNDNIQNNINIPNTNDTNNIIQNNIQD
jgi:hypothetical protein